MVYNSRNIFELETILGKFAVTLLGGFRRGILIVWL
jgi:hypothetical protein